jgi:hypothetical protein
MTRAQAKGADREAERDPREDGSPERRRPGQSLVWHSFKIPQEIRSRTQAWNKVSQ